MKTLVIFAAGVAVFAAASTASAQSNGGGHYEWRDAPAAGPRAIPQRVRHWVMDRQPSSADCDCAKMKTAAIS